MVENGKIFLVREEIFGPRKGKIVTDVDACMACGVCVKKCPTDALRLEKDEVVVDSDKCILCGECDIICPVNAIKLKTESTKNHKQRNMIKMFLSKFFYYFNIHGGIVNWGENFLFLIVKAPYQ